MQSRFRIWLAAFLLVGAAVGLIHPASAQDQDPEATVQALETKVVKLQATNEALRTEVAQLDDDSQTAVEPTSTPRSQAADLIDQIGLTVVPDINWQVKVVKADEGRTAPYPGKDIPSAEGHFIFVYVVVTNTSSQVLIPEIIATFSLVDKAFTTGWAQTIDATSGATLEVESKLKDYLESGVPAGESFVLVAAFDVPSTVGINDVIFTDSTLSFSVDLAVLATL